MFYVFQFTDRVNPTDKHLEVMINKYGIERAPFAPQIFGNAGKEHMEKYGMLKYEDILYTVTLLMMGHITVKIFVPQNLTSTGAQFYRIQSTGVLLIVLILT